MEYWVPLHPTVSMYYRNGYLPLHPAELRFPAVDRWAAWRPNIAALTFPG